MKVYLPELRAMLSAGETPVAAAMCHEAFGAERVERSPADLERMFRLLPRPLRERLTAAAQAEPVQRKPWERMVDVLTGTDSLVDFDEAAFFGVTASGHVGSCAARLLAALRGRSFVYCVVSDRRLIIAQWSDDPVAFAEVASLPLTAVLNARRVGTIAHRGRVVLDFADLSQLAVMTGFFFSGAADRLVAAITRGRTTQGR